MAQARAEPDKKAPKPPRRPVPRVLSRALDFKAPDRLTAAEALKEGLPYSKLALFQRESGMSLEAIADAARIPRRTLARRKSAGRLTQEESERLFRLALLFEKTVDLFEGDKQRAKEWLGRENAALGHRAPLDLAETELGGREVESLLGRLEHGVF